MFQRFQSFPRERRDRVTDASVYVDEVIRTHNVRMRKDHRYRREVLYWLRSVGLQLDEQRPRGKRRQVRIR